MPTASCSERNRPIGRRWRRRGAARRCPDLCHRVRLDEAVISSADGVTLRYLLRPIFSSAQLRPSVTPSPCALRALPPMEGCATTSAGDRRASRDGPPPWAQLVRTGGARARSTRQLHPARPVSVHGARTLRSRHARALHTRSCAAAGDLACTGTRTRRKAEATQKGEK